MDWRYNNEVNIPVRSVKVKGELVIPLQAQAIVIFPMAAGAAGCPQPDGGKVSSSKKFWNAAV
jgi:hypothetical protein